MESGFPGLGTVINVGAIVIGALAGMAAGSRFPARTRSVVTDALGLVTLLVAALSAASVGDAALAVAVGPGAPVLVVLGSLLIGGIIGSALHIEESLESLAGRVHAWTARRAARSAAAGPAAAGSAAAGSAAAGSAAAGEAAAGEAAAHSAAARERFVEGWLTTSLLFCVGPLAILGSLSDGLGLGIDQLLLKSVLDGFSALAFASTFGIGVLASAGSVAVVQGSLTAAGLLLGSVLPDAHIAAMTATGGLMLAGIGLRLLRIRDVPVGDLLPALVVAPVLTQVIVALR